ncbi:hypothetical protein [Streptomyces axinellae]|uniref:Uncharacterized protein n=1 Tax=Streptomyces axinellae TaxID=552788 RepID=A0ABP6C1Y6_9ACTN
MPEQMKYTDDEVEGHLRRFLATRDRKSTTIGYAIENDINLRTLRAWLTGDTHPKVYEKFSPEERENFSVRGICTDQEGAELLRQFADGNYRTIGEFTDKWDLSESTFKAWVSGKMRPQLRALLSKEHVAKLDRLRPLWATPQSVRSTLDHALNPKGNKYSWMNPGSAGVGSSASTVRAPQKQAPASRSAQPPVPSEPEEQVSAVRQEPASSDAPKQPQPQGQLPQLTQEVARAARTKLPAGPRSGAATSTTHAAASSNTTSYQGRKRAGSPSSSGRKGQQPKTP